MLDMSDMLFKNSGDDSEESFSLRTIAEKILKNGGALNINIARSIAGLESYIDRNIVKTYFDKFISNNISLDFLIYVLDAFVNNHEFDSKDITFVYP